MLFVSRFQNRKSPCNIFAKTEQWTNRKMLTKAEMRQFRVSITEKAGFSPLYNDYNGIRLEKRGCALGNISRYKNFQT